MTNYVCMWITYVRFSHIFFCYVGTNVMLAMTLQPKPNHPKGSVQKSQDRKKEVNFGQMWRFHTLFFSFAMAWCIINSCHKFARSIRNTTLKLCAFCVKQFFRNAQNYGKPNHGFCTIITHQPTHRCLCANFWPKTKPEECLTTPTKLRRLIKCNLNIRSPWPSS